VGVGVAVIAIAAGIFFFVRRRRNRAANAQANNPEKHDYLPAYFDTYSNHAKSNQAPAHVTKVGPDLRAEASELAGRGEHASRAAGAHELQ